MKVVKTKVDKSEISSELDLFSDAPTLSREAKARVKREIGDYLVEQINNYLSESKSPVSGETIPGLKSKEYRKKKIAEGLPGSANLEFTGSLRDSIDYRVTADGIKIGVFGKDAPKADGHNNFSGDSKLPRRRFLPTEGQSFKSEIQKEAERIILEAYAESQEITRNDLRGIESKTELWAFLKETYPDLTRAQILFAIESDQELAEILDDLDLMRFL